MRSLVLFFLALLTCQGASGACFTGLLGVSPREFTHMRDQVSLAKASLSYMKLNEGRFLVSYDFGKVFPSSAMTLGRIEEVAGLADGFLSRPCVQLQYFHHLEMYHKDLNHAAELVYELQIYLARDVYAPFIKNNFYKSIFAQWTQYFERQRLKAERVRAPGVVPEDPVSDPVSMFLKPLT